ncbi:hypothetical protein C8C77_1049 [Halanaerobium saccharolyticum]|uniref:Uncharacterized protein n=1 Tax=Halanaerobium saccharolyticum TaxID=43595 RepID=A0A4R7ZCX4_9FIRM|nr:hypothetical protein [Halanaerobium saccharolyticum]RAK10622.1 hypothetical protein C7958_104143 [Halanaerobium saccharolyticum]TDW06621.1 hypothetical protein C8C77_1049 [Halanaerobium saccharolyticum]TDX62256.1 hypothetical protein C7956_1049 [Halanaerobium saccharolyticum]
MSGKVKISAVLIILLFLVINSNSAAASYLTSSRYKIEMVVDTPEEIISDPININASTEKKAELKNNNIYIDSFVLQNSAGQEIASQYIKIETPYLNQSLDKSYRFLLMKNGQEKSWFKISLLRPAFYFGPGKYSAKINIDELDWEIDIEILIKPFVVLNLNENRFEFEISNASQTDFFIAPDLYEINVDSNHTDWEIQVALEQETFLNQQGNSLSPDNLYYRLETVDRQYNLNELKKEEFASLEKNGIITMINGSDYKKGLTAIRFGVDLEGENNSVQPAGLYSGTIIFTLRTLEDKNSWRSDDL